MMLRQVTLLTLALAASVFAAAPCIARGQSTPNIARDFILVGDDAVGMLSPRVVCGASAGRLVWSGDGSILLVHRLDTPSMEQIIVDVLQGKVKPDASMMTKPREELVFYSVGGKRVRAVVPFTGTDAHIDEMEWLTGAQQVMVRYTRAISQGQNAPPNLVTSVVLVSADGRVTPILETDNENTLFVGLSPLRPLMAVIDSPQPPTDDTSEQPLRLRVFGSDGKAIVTSSFKVAGYSLPVWGADGGLYVLSRHVDTKARKLITTYNRVDLSDGHFESVAKVPEAGMKSYKNLPYRVEPYQVPNAAGGSKQRIDALALRTGTETGPDTMALISTDAQYGELSPSGEAIAYISKGIPMVRPIVHIPKVAFMAARDAARKTELLSNAKQIGLAFLMFSNDMDDELPMNNADWQNQIDPYLKNRDLTNGFVYSFQGGKITDVQEPASTMLGYIPGPGGKAVVYVDGHAKWIPDPKKP